MEGMENRIEKIAEAFGRDGFTVDRGKDVYSRNGRLGIRASHIHTPGKYAYYVEGDPGSIGYLWGLMAEPRIAVMASTYIENVVFDFFSHDEKDYPGIIRKAIGKLIVNAVYALARKALKDIPAYLIEEMKAVEEGCRAANPDTTVNFKDLLVLNVGVDIILSIAYSGRLPIRLRFRRKRHRIGPERLRIPVMCNAFYLDSELTADAVPLFGRDFMFPTAGVFQDCAAPVIYRPDSGLPFTAVTAPGICGCIVALNDQSVVMGVDMAGGANCRPSRPGLNSLLLVRHAVQHGSSLQAAVNHVAAARRGVTWLYPAAEGKSGQACIIEAGKSGRRPRFLRYPACALKRRALLPARKFLRQNRSCRYDNGIMVRRPGFVPPPGYGEFNPALIDYHRKINGKYTYVYDPADFGVTGFINKVWTEKNCPNNDYFAPQRESIPGVVLCTNHFIIPEMRLFAMRKWTSIVSSHNINDIQWRYDELNRELVEALREGKISCAKARSLIDFLSPCGPFPAYHNPEGKDPNTIPIAGSVSLVNLAAFTVESHFGYYGDPWVGISLKNYI